MTDLVQQLPSRVMASRSRCHGPARVNGPKRLLTLLAVRIRRDRPPEAGAQPGAQGKNILLTTIRVISSHFMFGTVESFTSRHVESFLEVGFQASGR